MSGNFEALLAELNTEVADMAKAMPAGGDEPADDADDVDTAATDKKVMAASGDGDADDEGGEPDGDADDEGSPMMGKSMTVEIDGKQVEAVDGTELVKSLMGQVEQLGGKLSAAEDKLAKALTDTLGVVKSQGELIKSLSSQVAKLSSAGRGRKSAVVVHEPGTDMAKSQNGGAPMLTGNEIMAKALTAQSANRMTAHDVARVEGYLNLGAAIPADLLSRLN
mgnify:CR=1 FL=1